MPVQAGGIADSDRRSEDSRLCTDEQTLTRADWQRCITQLTADGRIEDASREQHLLDLAFPE